MKEQWMLFVLEYRRWLNAGAAFFAGVCLLVVYFQMAPDSGEYTKTEALVLQWEASGEDQDYLEMRKALKKVPVLEKKYGSMIAQKLFQKNNLSEALHLAENALVEMRQEAPFHAVFAETSLLIEQGFFQEALERSVGLKERIVLECDVEEMVGLQPAGGSLLLAHNLIRIACLQKELKNRPGEKAAWEELELFLEGKKSLASLIFHNFKEKELSLNDYIAERKKQL